MKNTIYLNSVNSHIDIDTGVVYTSTNNVDVYNSSFSLIDDNVSSQWLDSLSLNDQDTVFSVFSKIKKTKLV